MPQEGRLRSTASPHNPAANVNTRNHDHRARARVTIARAVPTDAITAADGAAENFDTMSLADTRCEDLLGAESMEVC